MATHVKLEDTMDLQATGRLAERLAGLKAAIVLDASEVGHLGGLAAQLILAAHRSGGPQGKGLHVIRPSAEFTAGMTRLGIDPQTLEEVEP